MKGSPSSGVQRVVQGDGVEIGRPQTPVSFDPRVDFATGALPVGVAIGDVNGDGKPDLVSVNTGANPISVLLGNGTGSFTTSAFATGAAPFNLAIGDLNGDGIPDLAVVNVNADTVSVLLGGGDGGFGAKTDFATGGRT